MQEQQFLAHYEAEDLHWWFRARRKIIADLVNKIVPNGSLMLDIGCGTGATVAYFADRYRSVGLDASKIAVEIASSRESGEFRFGSSPDDFPKLADQASICLITDVLEHIEQEKDFFADWVRAVQSNTYFLVTVPADPRLWSMHDVSQ